MKKGGGQETSSPRSNFAVGERVAGAPQREAAGHEEGGGGLDTTPKISLAGGAGRRSRPEEPACARSTGMLQLFGWEEDIPPWPPLETPCFPCSRTANRDFGD
ncbi:UNVERIFIED_CONTAM: hypothetical protein FKN15_032236 [Acipenser sinensis]